MPASSFLAPARAVEPESTPDFPKTLEPSKPSQDPTSETISEEPNSNLTTDPNRTTSQTALESTPAPIAEAPSGSAQAAASVEVAETCSLTANKNKVSATVEPGIFVELGGDLTFNVACNDSEGYVVYAVGVSGDKEGQTDLIGPKFSILTGLAQSGDQANWSFKLSDPSDGLTIQPNFDAYSAIPSKKTAVAKRLASTSETAPDSFKATYGVYTTPTTAPGVYTGKVSYTVFHPNSVIPKRYSITYHLNDGQDGPADIPDTETVSDLIQIDPKEPTKDGFEFGGWCDQATTDTTCSGTTYEAGADLHLLSGNNDIHLYAIWQGSSVPMQDWKGCNELQTNETITLTDARDNNRYMVAKLLDGRCWMTENLRIAGVTIDNSDSDMTSGTFEIPGSAEADEGGRMKAFDVGSENNVNTIENKAVYIDSTYGGYYTWFVATAGSGNKSVTEDDTNVPDSICPKGWRLPRGDSASYNDGAEFDILVAAYGGNNATGSEALRKQPVPGFINSGYISYHGGRLTGANESDGSGSYWSSTAGGSLTAYHLEIVRSEANPGGLMHNERPAGYSVRCLTRQ